MLKGLNISAVFVQNAEEEKKLREKIENFLSSYPYPLCYSIKRFFPLPVEEEEEQQQEEQEDEQLKRSKCKGDKYCD